MGVDTRPADRPIAILIAALGGEGGGVLTEWIVAAATAEGYPVQSTSIPGVAQRTGATSYYIELFPRTHAELGGALPVLSLYPCPGETDIVVASEILEAGRAMERGFVTPDRTTLIASTHRVYAIAEKASMADGRFDAAPIVEAARQLARRAVLFDADAAAERAGGARNAVLLGVMAGCGVLPLDAEALRRAIERGGIAVASNLAAFAAGLAIAEGPAAPEAATAAARPGAGRPRAGDLLSSARARFPVECLEVIENGLARLIDYQDERYARLYLDRLETVLEADRAAHGAAAGFRLTRETGRHLALWMSYEDIVRVAQLKTRGARFDRVRAEVRAKPGEPVHVTEFFKPGLDELCALLPPSAGRSLRAWAERRGLRDRLHLRMHVRTTTVSGFLRLRLLAGLRAWRPRSCRYAEEHAGMERWLAAVVAAARRDHAFGLAVVECAGLLKGYGDTHRRAWASFTALMDRVVEPLLTGAATPADAARRVAAARRAALADPDGKALARELDRIEALNAEARAA